MKGNRVDPNIKDLFKSECLFYSKVIGDIYNIADFYMNGEGRRLKNRNEALEVLDELVKTYIIFEPDFDEIAYIMENKIVPSNDGGFIAKLKHEIPNIILDKISELAQKVQKKKEVLEEKQKGKESTYRIYEKLNNLEL